jgi:hypothetical protein
MNVKFQRAARYAKDVDMLMSLVSVEDEGIPHSEKDSMIYALEAEEIGMGDLKNPGAVA